MKIENDIIIDIFHVFNATLNINAQNALKRTIKNKLQNVEALKNQQQIIKSLLLIFIYLQIIITLFYIIVKFFL